MSLGSDWQLLLTGFSGFRPLSSHSSLPSPPLLSSFSFFFSAFPSSTPLFFSLPLSFKQAYICSFIEKSRTFLISLMGKVQYESSFYLTQMITTVPLSIPPPFILLLFLLPWILVFLHALFIFSLFNKCLCDIAAFPGKCFTLHSDLMREVPVSSRSPGKAEHLQAVIPVP